MKIGPKMVITGIILPYNWDDEGRVIQIAIYTNTEEVYVMKHNALSRELLSLTQKMVEIRGKIREHPDGKKLLAAQNYIVFEEAVDDET